MMPRLGGPRNSGGQKNATGAIVGLTGKIQIGAARVDVQAEPSVAGVRGVGANLEQAPPLAGTVATYVNSGAGPGRGKPHGNGAGVHREVAGPVGFRGSI